MVVGYHHFRTPPYNWNFFFLHLGRCQDVRMPWTQIPPRRSTRMWSYLIFAIHLHFLWTCLIRVREHGTSRNDPKQTTIQLQVTIGSCNDCKMFQSFQKVGSSSLWKLQVTILKPWSLRTSWPAHPSGTVCVEQSFHEEPFFWISHKQLIPIWVFPNPKMDGLYWKTLLKWMIGGYHYFRKHPNDSNIFYFWVFWCMRPIVFFKNLVFHILMNFHQLSHHVSSHAIECPSLVLPYHFLIWILFSSYHFSPAFPTILASI